GYGMTVTRHRHGPDRREPRAVHGEVREPHQRGPGNRAARPQRGGAEGLAHAAAAIPQGFDRQAAVGMKHLWKLGGEKTLELANRHHQRHSPALPAATAVDDRGRMKKTGEP